MQTKEYKEFKEQQNKTFNEFIKDKVFWAFNQEQFNEGMKKIGLEPTEENKRLLVGWYNGATRRTDVSRINEFLQKQKDELYKRINQDKSFGIQAFYYEFMNQECGISGRFEEARNVLGYTKEDINNNEYLKEVHHEAYKAFISWCDKHCW